MHAQEMRMSDVVAAVAKELNLEKLFESQEGRAAIAAQINKATKDLEEKLQSEIAEERKLRTAAEEAVNELTQRVARKEKLDREFGMHVDHNGNMRPDLSRECSEHLIGVLREAHGRGTRALSSGVDSEGGYLVAPEFAAEILRVVPTVGLYPRLAREVPMTTDEKNFGTLLSSFAAYWPAENTAITPSYPSFGQLKLINKILAAYTEAPEGLLDDATPEMGALLGDLIVEALANELDRVGIFGKSATNGGTDPFDGLAYAANIVVKSLAATKTHISDLTADDLLDVQTSVPDGAREGASYILSPTVLNAIRKIKDSQGDYIWQRPVDGAPGTIWGKPYHETEKMPAYSTAVDAAKPFVLYGNWKKNAIVATRKQIAVKASDVAGDSMKKIQTAIRAHGRFGVNAYGPAIAVIKTAAA